MELTDIKLGTPVEIRLSKRDDNTIDGIKVGNSSYITSVFDFTKKGELIINMPTKEGKIISLPLNMDYLIVLTTSDGLFQLNGKMVNRGRIEGFPVYVIKPNSSLKKVQRREYYRFKCLLDVSIIPIKDKVAELPDKNMVEDQVKILLSHNEPYYDGNIIDISGGGAKVHTKRYFDFDKYVYMSFLLERPENTENPEKTEIINVVARKVESKYRDDLNIYEHRVEFIFKETDDREIIIKYIFDEDRRLRKKDQG